MGSIWSGWMDTVPFVVVRVGDLEPTAHYIPPPSFFTFQFLF